MCLQLFISGAKNTNLQILNVLQCIVANTTVSKRKKNMQKFKQDY